MYYFMKFKVSTLLTVGLLTTGSLFSDAWAEKLSSHFDINAPAAKISNGTIYFLVQQDASNLAFGFSKYDADDKKVELSTQAVNVDATLDVEAYLWKVTESSALGGKYVTTFTNVLTGQVLRYTNGDTPAIVTEYSDANVKASYDTWAWEGWNTYEKTLAGESVTTKLYAAEAVMASKNG